MTFHLLALTLLRVGARALTGDQTATNASMSP
jgi:hypothetical protein